MNTIDKHAAATKVLKLLALALDASAHDGESHNAAVAAIREMRRSGLKLRDLGIEERRIVEVEKTYEPWWAVVEMPFGKHKGKRLGSIAEDNPDYLVWIGANVELHGTLAEAIGAALEAVGV